MTTPSELRFWDADKGGSYWKGPRQALDLYIWDDGTRQAIWDAEMGEWRFNNASGEHGKRFRELMEQREEIEHDQSVVCRMATYYAEAEDFDEPVENLDVNEKGGKQSKLRTRFDVLPPAALTEIAEVMGASLEKYGQRNWRLIPQRSHLNHAMTHIFSYLNLLDNGVDSVEGSALADLSHAATRLLMALEIELVGEDASE